MAKLADNATHMYGWTLLGTTLVNRSFNRIASFSSEVSCLAIVGDDLREALFTPLTGSKSCQVFETKRRGGWRGFDIDALGEKVSFLRKNGTFRISANFFFFSFLRRFFCASGISLCFFRISVTELYGRRITGPSLSSIVEMWFVRSFERKWHEICLHASTMQI